MKNTIILRSPTPEDGYSVHQLIKSCSPLDENSIYANLLQCTHFSQTSLLAQENGKVIGFISGYIPPENQHCLFIWQVAVAQEARGQKLAQKMLLEILIKNTGSKISKIETTITKDNLPSRALFQRVSTLLKGEIKEKEYFDRDIHFLGEKESEYLISIGPFELSTINKE